MNKKLLLLAIISAQFSTFSHAEGDFKYRKLKPADPPCLFLLDENTGDPTGNPVNPPCQLGQTSVNPGDNVSPKLRKQFGKIAPKQRVTVEKNSVKQEFGPRQASH